MPNRVLFEQFFRYWRYEITPGGRLSDRRAETESLEDSLNAASARTLFIASGDIFYPQQFPHGL